MTKKLETKISELDPDKILVCKNMSKAEFDVNNYILNLEEKGFRAYAIRLDDKYMMIPYCFLMEEDFLYLN